MSAGRDQVSLLTRGLKLPEPPIHPLHIAVIVEAICDAWDAMVADWPDTAASHPERIVNSALITYLKRALRGRTPFATLVSSVDRGVEQHSFDGKKFENRPDLNFLLTGRDRHFPFVGECKIIDIVNRKDLKKYRIGGIERFERGDYAWASSEGIMVAYVRDATEAHAALPDLIGSTLVPFAAFAGNHYQSCHSRTFSYVDRDPVSEPPGNIAVFHVWLESTKVGAEETAELAPSISPTSLSQEKTHC